MNTIWAASQRDLPKRLLALFVEFEHYQGNLLQACNHAAQNLQEICA